MSSRIALCTLLGLLLVRCSALAQAPGAPETYRPPAGAYQHLWLEFKGGASSTKAFVGLRGNKAITAWFLDGAVPGGVKPAGGYRLLVDRSDLTIAGDTLRGSIVLRQVSIWAPMARLAQVTLTLEAKKAGADFTGAWTAEVLGGAKTSGGLSGTLTDEAALRAAQSFAPGADWPGYHGPHGANRSAETKTALLDDLAQIRPVWRSEQPVLSGWGSGTDGRYAHRAAVGTVNGGTGTPVFADNRVYLFHYVPSGDADAAKLAALLEEAGKTFKEMLPVERAGLTDFLRPYSDTIVTCIDAQPAAPCGERRFPGCPATSRRTSGAASTQPPSSSATPSSPPTTATTWSPSRRPPARSGGPSPASRPSRAIARRAARFGPENWPSCKAAASAPSSRTPAKSSGRATPVPTPSSGASPAPSGSSPSTANR